MYISQIDANGVALEMMHDPTHYAVSLKAIILDNIVVVQDCEACGAETRAHNCVYSRNFEPVGKGASPNSHPRHNRRLTRGSTFPVGYCWTLFTGGDKDVYAR